MDQRFRLAPAYYYHFIHQLFGHCSLLGKAYSVIQFCFRIRQSQVLILPQLSTKLDSSFQSLYLSSFAFFSSLLSFGYVVFVFDDELWNKLHQTNDCFWSCQFDSCFLLNLINYMISLVSVYSQPICLQNIHRNLHQADWVGFDGCHFNPTSGCSAYMPLNYHY